MRMDRFFVRIQKITLKNFKNVKYGTVSLTNPLKKYKASVLGLYGQNGSGKTALIEAIQILKTLLCGASLPEGSENYINVDSDNAQLIFEFCMNDNDSGYAYIVEYSFGLKRVEVDSSNTMDSSNEQKVYHAAVYNECIKYSVRKVGEETSRMQTLVDTSSEDISNPKTKFTVLVGNDKELYKRLAIAKALSYEKSLSFVFSNRFMEPVRQNSAVQATCQNTGNIEYWECETCAKYYSDEAAAAEVSPADVIIAKTDHKWSVKYTYDKNGHWHKCEYCDAVTGAESHVSSGEATATEAEYCTVCGYIITPRKGGSSGGHVSGGGRDTTPTDTRPIINGERKTWTEIAADLGRQNGGSATISMSGETTVPAEVIKAIADRKIKVEFAYDSTKSWLIDGAKITTVSAADFSLFPGSVDTSSLRGVSGGKYRISADIPAEIRFTFLKRYAGEFANVYKLVDGKLVFQTCIKLAEDGTAVVPGMSAPGEYAVMVCRYSDRQGDFDNNGVLDIYDAVALLRYSVGLESGENLQLIDLNGDGMVNCADASTVLRWLVGLSA